MGRYIRSLFDAFSRYKGLVSKRSIVSSGNINIINAFRFQINPSAGSSNSLINGGSMRKIFYSIGKKLRYMPHIGVSALVISNLLINGGGGSTRKIFYSIGKKLIYMPHALVISNLLTQLIRYKYSETVPYSKRKRVMILNLDVEKEFARPFFEKIKASFGNRILPPDHSASIRVQRIGQNIVEAALKTRDEKEKLKHLEGLEFIVVDEATPNAGYHPARKIIVFTGMLEHLKSDAEIATVLGHELAHAVARHEAETISHLLLLQLRIMFLPCLIMPRKLVRDIYGTLFLKRQRRRELEADYIGMLLMASAGYDPRVAPLRYKRMVEITDKLSMWESIFSTHPSEEKRAQLLSRPKVMKEAMCFYREAQLKQGISSAISKARFSSY